MRAWFILNNPPACSSFKTVAEQSSNWLVKHPHQSRDFERRLRMPFKRGAANANFRYRTSTRLAVAIQHDPDRAQSSGPASNPPAQHFHCGLASCGIELISTTTGRPLPGISICTSCRGVVWCANCLLVAFIERLPHPMRARVHMCVCVCMCACAFVCVRVCVRAFLYLCMCVYFCVYVYDVGVCVG